MKVRVDSRETEKRKKKARKVFGEDIIIEQLNVGDYVYEDCAVEFKTVSDFIGSVKNKRIYNQAINMSENYAHHYVIIYGDVGKTLYELYRMKHSFTVKQYLGALASLSQITKVLSVENEQQAFSLMKKLFEKSTDGKNRMVKQNIGRKHKNKIVAVLSIIGDINSKRAEQLITALDIRTFTDLTRITYDDIIGVKGFGDKTAQKIIRWIR